MLIVVWKYLAFLGLPKTSMTNSYRNQNVIFSSDESPNPGQDQVYESFSCKLIGTFLNKSHIGSVPGHFPLSKSRHEKGCADPTIRCHSASEQKYL